MLIDFADQVVVITGSSGGFGLATAEAFLESGASVMLNGTKPQKLENALEGLKDRFENVEAHVADISTRTGADDLIGETQRRFKSIDVLVNNAGTAQNLSLIHI